MTVNSSKVYLQHRRQETAFQPINLQLFVLGKRDGNQRTMTCLTWPLGWGAPSAENGEQQPSGTQQDEPRQQQFMHLKGTGHA